MPTLQLSADGEVMSYEESEDASYNQGEGVTLNQSSIGDPNAEQPYTDQQLADALPLTQGAGSGEQLELTRMRERANWCTSKANEVTGYNKEGQPIWARGESERAQLLRQAKGLEDSLPLQLLMSQRSIATRYLDGQKQIANAQATLDQHIALEKAARDIVFTQEATELAALMRKRHMGGQTM